MRRLRYSTHTHELLSRNEKFTFSQQYALMHYDSESIFSFIPKNGCTSLRASLAIANGCIKDLSEISWIHDNNITFSASLRDLQRAPYTSVILRCPYSRLSSAYLDKFAGFQPNSKFYFEQRGMTQEQIDKFNFEKFIRSLEDPITRNLDVHWKPQIDFLVYYEYDDYFNLSEIGTACNTIKIKTGLDLLDTRKETKNGINHLTTSLSLPNPHLLTPTELQKAREAGFSPSHKSMYTDELIEIVNRNYREDIELFIHCFGRSASLF